ncbi:MAG: glycosyltransferase family 39 protein [Candidatus Shapirobacteria bacterium]|nr:glycosyltransferase family 39 protein [Candidatus Shapirobacteria bacterium]MDD3002406.1 glycosyltransferase family 39 protein [Candidatus Shapirobacteria bacterium]MDD4383286.1 glycosyltransferase family 39 protein [Candidatus Shapirobacteria bacterium]
MKYKNKILILIIFIIAFSLRIYGFNWDQGNHLHPDERMIAMVAEKITFPTIDPKLTLSEKFGVLFDPKSSLNPHFFAYGSFPIYFLKAVCYLLSFIEPTLINYDKMNLVGRFLSAIFDSLTVIFIYKITLITFKSNKKAIFAALFYSLSILPIQLSHFYAVDVLLNFFIFFTLYQTICLYQKFNFKNAFFVGLGFGLSLATKISATVLVFSLGIGLIISVFLSLKKEIFGEEISFLKKIKKYLRKIFSLKFWSLKKQHQFKDIILYFLLIMFVVEIVFIICEPFAIFNFSEFWRQLNEQETMTKSAFVFPYTLQYVNTIPYIYQLKNIFLWGLGPVFGILSLLGGVYTFSKLIKGLFTPGNEKSEGSQLILFSFFIIYFLIVGKFAIKFNRYCLPLYPIFAIFAANFIFSFKKKKLIIIFSSLHLFWLFAFMNIYNVPNTRVSATEWINQNISPGNTILREHWDDGLPLGYHDDINLIDLPLYDPDNDPQKWPLIQNYLKQSDYLIIASNRLYTPLQKLINCENLPEDKCYATTANYYKDLFSGKLSYIKVAEFSNYPNISGFNINDQSADESFTVYDHPKVIIFKNTHSNN